MDANQIDLNIKSLIEDWEAGKIDKQNPELLLNVCASFFKVGNLLRAKQIADDYYHLMPFNPAFVGLYGALLRRLGQLQESRRIFEEGIKVFNDDPFVLNNYANLLIDLQDYEQAGNILESCLSTNPPNTSDIVANIERLRRIRSNINQQYNESTKETQAIDPLHSSFGNDEVEHSLRRITKIDRKNLRSKLESQLQDNDVISQGELQETLLEFLKLCRLSSSVSPAQTLEDLRIIYMRGMKIHTLYDIAADCFIALEDFDKAEACLMTIVVLGEDTHKTLVNLANIALMRSKYSLARALLTKCIESQSTQTKDESDAISNLTGLLMRHNDEPF